MVEETESRHAKWKAILVFCVVVPIFVFAVIGLPNLGSGPLILSETVNQNPVTWESERPTYIFDFEQKINSTFFDGGWINASVLMSTFDPDDQFFVLDLNLTANLNEGFVQNITVTLQSNSSASYVDMGNIDPANPTESVNWENLNLTRYSEGPSGIEDVEKAFLEFLGKSNSHQVSISVWPMWWFEGAFNETEQMNVSFATTYFNGTEYKKVLQPFSLRLFSEYEGTFATAKEVVANQTVTDFIEGNDNVDFFKIYLEQGETFNVTVFPSSYLWAIILRLYSSADENNPLVSSPVYVGRSLLVPESISYSIKSTGWYYVKVEWVAGDGLYTMTLAALTSGIS